MPTLTDLPERYIELWNERDEDRRARLVSELWAEDARYCDPLVVVDGHAEIAATIGAVQAQFPELGFRLSGPADAHHNQVRFAWELGPAGAAAPIAGFDVAVVGEDGRIATVLGFLDRVPAA